MLPWAWHSSMTQSVFSTAARLVVVGSTVRPLSQKIAELFMLATKAGTSGTSFGTTAAT